MFPIVPRKAVQPPDYLSGTQVYCPSPYREVLTLHGGLEVRAVRVSTLPLVLSHLELAVTSLQPCDTVTRAGFCQGFYIVYLRFM